VNSSKLFSLEVLKNLSPNRKLYVSVVVVKGHGNEWLPILRMYRGVFLLVMIIFLVAINTCGWRAAGVNHVLIFELNPRTHLTYQQVLEVEFAIL
jgi:hypothetical protein